VYGAGVAEWGGDCGGAELECAACLAGSPRGVCFERRLPVETLEKKRKQRERWEKVEERGRIFHSARWVLIAAGGYAAVALTRILCFKFGWLRSPGSIHWDNAVAVVLIFGLTFAIAEWWEMKRILREAPPNESIQEFKRPIA
jgi:hypothetical protein